MLRAGAALVFTALALTLGACSSPSYKSRWEKADTAKKADPYSGAWVGHWISKKHPGEGGELWCIVTPEAHDPVAGENDYTAEFKARWRKVFASTHSVSIQAKPAAGTAGAKSPGLLFSGTSELHTILGNGTYKCEGILTPTAFQAKYDATYDYGFLQLSRP